MSHPCNYHWTPRVGTTVCLQALCEWLSRPPMQGRLVLLVGAPASGKSTIANGLEEAGLKLVGLDRIREHHYGDEGILGDDQEVLDIFYRDLSERFRQKQPVVVDNTNVFTEHRQAIVDLARRAGYKDICLMLLEVPLRVCLKNNRRRIRRATPDFIKERHAQLQRQRPSPIEGSLIVLRRASTPGHFRITSASL